MTGEELKRIEQTPMFFIVGRPRTGSTLLRMLFDAHPNVVIPQEWPMLMALYHQFGNVKKWDAPTLNRFYDALFQKLRISYWEIQNWPELDARRLKESILACEGEHTFETLFKVVYSSYHSYFDKKEILLFGDKNPVYSNQADQLAMLFPTAKFIHLIRDYRDNIVSMLDVDFEMPNTTLLAYRWKYSIDTINRTAARFPEHFVTLRYEDLVADPQSRFAELCHFLEIPEAPSIFEFQARNEELEAHVPKELIDRYFKNLFKPIDDSRVGLYRNRLSNRQIRIAELVAGKTGKNAGYIPVNTQFSPLLRLWTFPAILYAKWLYAVGWMVSLLPYRCMMWLLNKPSVLVKMYTKLKR